MSDSLVPKEQVAPPDQETLLSLVKDGDLVKLTSAQRLSYYLGLCSSLGLNPHTRPFQFLTLKGKLVLYAAKDATDQLRKVHGISVEFVDRGIREGGIFEVVAKAYDSTGRADMASGSVSVIKEGKEEYEEPDPRREGRMVKKVRVVEVPMAGEDLANARMKAETKAKRRVTLSICGLGFLDESELDTIKGRVERVGWPEITELTEGGTIEVNTVK